MTLLFRQFLDDESKTYSYLIADMSSRMALLVDPCLERCGLYLKILAELGLTLKYSIETHVHADHITAADKLRSETRCQVFVPENTSVENADGFIHDKECLAVGEIIVTAIATPGHTESHLAYYVNGDRVLTGDALFIRGCGRTDFQGGDAGLLFDAITTRLFSLPDSTLVFPGHDYQGQTVSTIGEEKKFNPRLAGKSRAEFIDIMNNLNLAAPKRINEALSANQRLGAIVS